MREIEKANFYALTSAHVRKLVSASPEVYKKMNMLEATQKYRQYLTIFYASKSAMENAKTFQQWLLTDV